MVDFYISSIRIRNFRGMRDLKIDIPNGRMTTIIGQNNSGKSNLLEAIALCLSPKYFSSYQIKPTDFWKSKKEISAEFFEIELGFTATKGSKLPNLRNGEGDLVEVKGVKIYAESDVLEGEQYLIDNKGERIFWGRDYAKIKDIAQWLPEMLFLTPNNLEEDYEKWKEGHINKLLKNYKDEFLANSAANLIRDYSELKTNSLKTKYWKDKVEPKLKKEMLFFTGNQTIPIIEPSLEDLDTWLWNGLTMRVIPEDDWPAVTHRQLGKGWQSLLRISVLKGTEQITEKNKSVFLCIDEPETYLTPFKQRKLREYLTVMAKKMNQVMIATHSNLMIDNKTCQKIVRLKMSKNGVEKNEFDGKIPNIEMNSEMILGRKVVVDMTDFFEDKNEIDWDESETVLIKNKNIEETMVQLKFLQSLGINWCAITDMNETTKILEKEQSVYDKIIEIKTKTQIKKQVEEWIGFTWQPKEVLFWD